MVKQYRSVVSGKVVNAMEFTGLRDIGEVEEFTGYRPHDVYQFKQDDPNFVSCCVSVPKGNGSYAKIAFAPGYYLIRAENETLTIVPGTVFHSIYEAMEETTDE